MFWGEGRGDLSIYLGQNCNFQEGKRGLSALYVCGNRTGLFLFFCLLVQTDIDTNLLREYCRLLFTV